MQYFIYQLRCPITKEIKYVGQTKNIGQRFDQHRWGSEMDSKEKLNWINELKSKKLIPLLEIIKIAKNKKEALILEKEYIIEYINNGENLFNLESLRYLKQYDKYGNLIGKFNTIREAIFKTGISVKTSRGLSGGYLFTYGDFDKNIFEKIKNNKKINCKIVIQRTKTGEFLNEFLGVREACRITGIDHRSIASVAGNKNPKRHTAGGFNWEYKI